MDKESAREDEAGTDEDRVRTGDSRGSRTRRLAKAKYGSEGVSAWARLKDTLPTWLKEKARLAEAEKASRRRFDPAYDAQCLAEEAEEERAQIEVVQAQAEEASLHAAIAEGERDVENTAQEIALERLRQQQLKAEFRAQKRGSDEKKPPVREPHRSKKEKRNASEVMRLGEKLEILQAEIAAMQERKNTAEADGRSAVVTVLEKSISESSERLAEVAAALERAKARETREKERAKEKAQRRAEKEAKEKAPVRSKHRWERIAEKRQRDLDALRESRLVIEEPQKETASMVEQPKKPTRSWQEKHAARQRRHEEEGHLRGEIKGRHSSRDYNPSDYYLDEDRHHFGRF